MHAFFTTYTYMFFSLLMTVVCLCCLMTASGWRRSILLSGALAAPFGFFSIFFVPDYWDPVRLIEFGAGFEDLLFSFAGGGLVWYCVATIHRDRLHIGIRWPRVALVYGLTSALGIILGFLLDLAGFGPMPITFCGFIVVFSVAIYLRPEFWVLAATGALSYGSLYFTICLLAFQLQPDFISQWNLTNLSGIVIFGIPLEELLWGIGFGTVWPLIVGYSFDVRVTSRYQYFAAPIRKESSPAG